MKNYYLVIVLLLVLGQGENLYAQWHCGTLSPTEQERQSLLVQYKSFIGQKSSKKGRLVNYKVAIKANIISGTTTPSAAILNENDVRTIISHANTYLQNVNIELYLLNNQVYEIKDDKYFEFKMADEPELRRKNDVQNAINIYFAKNISLPDLTILGGYAALPSPSASSNRIFYSYFDHTAEDVQTLKNKTFLHEIGHYFGLLHTFQDSNNPDVSKRELVTRGVGANCSAMGDQLCDTSADPFERLPLVTAFKCNDVAPADVSDANGEHFMPPVSNIMSYHQGCGNEFTEQQYQKMQASFAIRFSPASEYQIASQGSNFVAIKGLDKKTYCAGDSIQIKYDLDGLFENNNQVYAELSDNEGKSYQRVEGKMSSNKVIIKLPDGLKDGDNYHVRLTATRPETFSPISESFAIRTYAKASLSSNMQTINAGESVDLLINLEGSGAWSFNLSDGTSVDNNRQSSYQFSRTLQETTTFSVVSVTNVCGEGLKNGNITVNVIQPQIQMAALATSTICLGQVIRLSIVVMGTLSFDNQLVIQISDPSGKNYTDLPTQVSLFNLSAQIPLNFQTGTGYRLKVLAKKSQLFSSTIGPLAIVAPPGPPVVIPVVNICQHSMSQVLNANGKNLKWYNEETDLTSYTSISPSTQALGSVNYYVSQTDVYGCESSKAKTQINVRPFPTATISGDRGMLTGDSTLLNINITGDLPAHLTLSDGRSFEANTTPFVLEVKPETSTTYVLKEVTNTCGVGTVLGSARITIMEPLANEELMKEHINIFPNPASQHVVVEFLSSQPTTSVISLVDMQGKILQERTVKTNQGKQEMIDLNSFITGNYVLRVKSEKYTITRKVQIEK